MPAPAQQSAPSCRDPPQDARPARPTTRAPGLGPPFHLGRRPRRVDLRHSEGAEVLHRTECRRPAAARRPRGPEPVGGQDTKVPGGAEQQVAGGVEWQAPFTSTARARHAGAIPATLRLTAWFAASPKDSSASAWSAADPAAVLRGHAALSVSLERWWIERCGCTLLFRIGPGRRCSPMPSTPAPCRLCRAEHVYAASRRGASSHRCTSTVVWTIPRPTGIKAL